MTDARTPKIEMYTSANCGYCVAAKGVLQRKGFAQIQEIRIDLEAGKREEMLQRADGRRTVPQIFINDVHVGGHDDMVALDRQGKLDALLAGQT